MVLVATQVKRRRGTTAENDAFTGAEGEITVDTEKHQLRVHDGSTQGGFVIGGGSGSGRNIGDIFYTTRTDTALNGAVECNGGTYSTADYEGAGSIGELLASGKLPYVSLADYATQITNNGVCGVFGWDGTGTTAFRVPTLKDMFIECGQANELGDYIGAGLPNITGTWAATSYAAGSGTSGAAYVDGTVPTTADGRDSRPRVRFDASRSSSIYGNSTTVQPEAVKYRAMIQLFNATTDEAVATVGTVVADVSNLKDMSNITSTGKETAVGWGMPNYNTAVSLSGSSFTATYKCWVVGGSGASGATEQLLYVNGIVVAKEEGDYSNLQIPLDIGDVLTKSAGGFDGLSVVAMKGA